MLTMYKCELLRQGKGSGAPGSGMQCLGLGLWPA